MTAEDVAGAVGTRGVLQWILLPLAFYSIGIVLIDTLRLLDPFRLFQLMSEIFHKISTSTTNFHLRTRRRKKILTWLREVLPEGQRVRDLTAVWRDGTILCDVIESVIPGSCSDRISKRHSHKSIQHGQILASRYLGVQPVFTHDELHQVIFSSYLERRFLRYLMSIRCAVLQIEENNGALSSILRLFRWTQNTAPERTREPAPPSLGCVVKGMGLVVAVQQRTACFCIHLLQPPYQVPLTVTPIPDIAVRIEGPNNDYGDAIIQLNRCKMSNEQTSNHSQNEPNKCPRNIPVNYSVTLAFIRISYIPLSPGVHVLSVTMHNEHVPGSPYLVTVDGNVTDVTGGISFGTPEVQQVSRIRPERRKVVFRMVDFITEQMELTQEGKLKKLPSDAKVSIRRVPRQRATCFSADGIHNRPETSSKAKNSMEHETVSDMDSNMRCGLSPATLGLNTDTSKGTPQTYRLSRRDMEFFIDRCRKIILLCSCLIKRNPSHNIFQTLHSIEGILKGRPVRFTDRTIKIIESGLKSIKPEMNDNTGESYETEISGTEVLKTDELLRSANVIRDCQQTLTQCEDIIPSTNKRATDDKATKNRSKCANIHITRNELTHTSRPITTGEILFERKSNICTNHKNISLYVHASEVIPDGKSQNTSISVYYIKGYGNSPAGITTNFISSTSSTSPSNIFYKPFQFGSDDEVRSYCGSINISPRREQGNQKLNNPNVNKQFQTINKYHSSTVAIETENCDSNAKEVGGLGGPKNGTYRAILVHITDDGYMIPAGQST